MTDWLETEIEPTRVQRRPAAWVANTLAALLLLAFVVTASALVVATAIAGGALLRAMGF